MITRKLKAAFRGRPRRSIWISLGLELFRCGKLRERMTKEQSNAVCRKTWKKKVNPWSRARGSVSSFTRACTERLTNVSPETPPCCGQNKGRVYKRGFTFVRQASFLNAIFPKLLAVFSVELAGRSPRIGIGFTKRVYVQCVSAIADDCSIHRLSCRDTSSAALHICRR